MSTGAGISYDRLEDLWSSCSARNRSSGWAPTTSVAGVSFHRFEEHLARCPFCQIYLDQMRQTIRAVGHLPDESITREALDTLLAYFRRWR